MATKAKDKKKEQKSQEVQEESSQEPEQESQQKGEAQATQAGQDSGSEQAGLDFQHPMLKGKTPEEIEQFVEFQDRMVRNQQEQLRMKNQQPQETPQPQKAPEPEVTDDDFYNRPVETMERVLQRMLKQEIEPFKQDLQRSQGSAARQELRNEFGDFDQMEPYIDQIISANNFPNPNDKGLLRTLYFTAKGMMSTQGNTNNQPGVSGMSSQSQQQQGSQETRSPRPAPPQHRPSASPLPESSGGQERKIELNEEEKRMAREWNMTPEEYVELRDADIQEFMESDNE